MKACKKCGEEVVYSFVSEDYYCEHCGSLSPDEVYSQEEIHKEWLQYKYLCMTPKEIREMRDKVKFG